MDLYRGAMDSWQERYEQAWMGALADASGLPEVALAGLVITFAHTAGRLAGKSVLEALRPLVGALDTVHLGLRTRYIGRSARWPLVVRVGRRRVRVRARTRLKAKQVRQIVEALGVVPGASGLRIQGRVQHYGRRAVAPLG